MKNREKLLNKNLYDLLIEMNSNLTGGECFDRCVMDAIGAYNGSYCRAYSKKDGGGCQQCIADYLEMEART